MDRQKQRQSTGNHVYRNRDRQTEIDKETDRQKQTWTDRNRQSNR